MITCCARAVATVRSVEVGAKLLELLREAVPAAKIMALLVNPTNPQTDTLSKNLQAAARTFGLQLHVLNASTERGFDTVFATLDQLRADGLIIGSDAFSRLGSNNSPHRPSATRYLQYSRIASLRQPAV